MASGVSFSSLGSGIDFTVIRDAIITQRMQPITRMQSKSTDMTNKVASLKQLNTTLAALTTATAALTDRTLGTGKNAYTMDSSIATASASAAASVGSFNLNVSRLASNLSQTTRSFSSATDTVLANGATSATFELRKGGATTGESITIDSTNNTLAGLRDAINAKGTGLTASIVDLKGDGTAQQLVLTSTDTGSSGRVELAETSSTGTLAGLNIQSVNPTDGDFSKLDAAMTVNGLAVTRSTNTITDLFAGVTLNLQDTGATTVKVSQSTDIENKLKGFVNAFNAVQAFANGQYTKDSQNRPTGILAGDPTLRNVWSQLREAVRNVSSDNGGSLQSLSDLGIAADNNGALSLDSSVLNAKLASNPGDVTALLYGKTTSNKGLFTNFNAMSSGISDDITGSVRAAITGYESSVTSLNKTIADRTDVISKLRDALTKRYSTADAAIGQLNAQQTSLTTIMTSYNNSLSKN